MDVLGATCAAFALIVVTFRSNDRLIVGAAGVSLLATALGPRDGELSTGSTAFALIEVAAMLALIVLAARRSTGIWPVAAAVLAVGLWVFRIEAPTSGLILIGSASWFAAALGAAGTGLYLRTLDTAGQRAVAATRALMARELHDFVAHDVSEVLALAQAGRVLSTESAELSDVLRGIERSARGALRSMDRTLDLLDGRIDVRHPAPALTDIPDLVDRFATSFAATVHLDMDVPDDVPRETGAAAYRVVLEALTNVRRHAPGASRVDVLVARRGAALVVEVTDDGSPGASRRVRGGRGLTGLTERVRLLGGSLHAGRGPNVGWRTAASLPVRPTEA